MSRQPLSVVVPTRDRDRLLEGCLDALAAALGPDDEVVVVDSASAPGTVAPVANRFGARFVRCDRPGASLARNQGWRAARHDVVAFVDDDVRVQPGWSDRVVSHFADRPETDFLTGRVEVPPEQLGIDRPVAITADERSCDIDTAGGGPVGQSANMAIRRSALAAVGGFDEELGPGGRLKGVSEDHDLFDRLLAAGLHGRYEPSVAAFHVQWRTPAALVRLDWLYGRGAGLRVAKLIRRDRVRAGAVARDMFWRWGVRYGLAAARQRSARGVVYAIVRLSGMFVGLARGFTLPLVDGHYTSRRVR
jgi:glycosyltransferase involved in cell wall biosynthesis